MIILEGCDCTGKTTLARQFASYLDWPIVKESVPPGPGSSYYLQRARELSTFSVVDRFHLGEMVYPIVKDDGRVPLETWQQQMIERVLEARGTTLVLCHASLGWLEKKFNEKGESFITTRQAEQVTSLFYDVFHRSILSSKFYFSPEMDEKLQLDVVQSIMTTQRKRLSIARRRVTLESVGSVACDAIMLVGERYGDGQLIGHGNLAFTSISGSSAYLARALALTDNPGAFYLTNAIKTGQLKNDARLLRAEIGLVRPLKIIALGNTAAKMLSKMNVDHVKVPHPQWWRRFKHHDVVRYAQKIMEAIDEGSYQH